MNGKLQLVFCESSRDARAGGQETVGLCLPVLVCPALILIMGSFIPHPGYRCGLAAIAALLALPTLPAAVDLLRLLWTRREVVVDLRERTITESVRTPWRTVVRGGTFDSVLGVWVVLDTPRRQWTISLELTDGKEFILDHPAKTGDALSLASQISEALGVQMQGRLRASAS